MSTPTITVIIPAFNEEKSIGKVVSDIPRDLVEHVIVVNNNSNDNTVEVAKSAGAIVMDEPRRGYGWACLKGIEKSRELKTDIVVFMDGDYSDYPEEIVKVIAPILEDNHDMVIGSRVLGKREKGSLTPQQVFGNRLATKLIRLFYGARFTDLGPFRAIKSDALEQLKMADKTYGWTIEMQIKASKEKMKFCEVPVNYRKRIGVSKVSGTIKGTVLAGIKIIFAIFKYRF
ncbi:MAG: glycosyltransferase family 2 protein [Crocinitomicaceae bacterium]|nr:glycosyltransferase family 2 protein [Crocinitomicaceae bacterium]MDC0100020.1 glycosyltransferase family 2 protein [Crocinitomicaceae bacterium]|tara:strand:- start:2098 stop:2787 length:690 start_codon:yes stop_codon:yes gene_type:complete